MTETLSDPEENIIKKNFLVLHALENRGMSHAKLARKTGKDIKWIAELEDGDILLTYNEAELLGKTLRVNPKYLYLYSLQLSKLRTRLHVLKTETSPSLSQEGEM